MHLRPSATIISLSLSYQEQLELLGHPDLVSALYQGPGRTTTPVSGEYYKISRQDLGNTTPHSQNDPQKWPPKMAPQKTQKRPYKKTPENDPLIHVHKAEINILRYM